MEQYKEIAKDPVKLEAKLKETWAKIDAKGEGFVTPQAFGAAMASMAQQMKIPGAKPPSPEEIVEFQKVLDPENTGKITYEGFERLAKYRIEKAKKEGKL